MLTRKQLAEARAFDRGRLVTAFLSGVPRERPVDAPRAGRAVVTGMALAGLLAAGAVIASLLAPGVPEGWDGPGLVVVKETGERYLIADKGAPLRPVVNVASAQLVLGVDVAPTMVPQRALRGRTSGDDIGILGAPQRLPDPGAFVETGWTACTASGAGVSVAIARHPGVATAVGTGVVVTADGARYWVVAEGSDHRARRYRVPPVAGADNLLEAVGLPPAAQAVRVPASWLGLFPQGGRLGPNGFGLGDTAGRRLVYAGSTGIAADARVGDYATVRSAGRVFLLTADGPAPLDPFAAALYTTAAELRRDDSGPREAGTGRLPGAGQAAPTWSAAHWPAAVLRPAAGPVCGELRAAAGTAPYVRLGVAPRGIAWSSPDADERDQSADPGVGALVRSGDGVWIVDDRARAYPVQGRTTLQTIGLDHYRAPLVPAAWIKVLGDGVPLSTRLARCSPASLPTPAPPRGC